MKHIYASFEFVYVQFMCDVDIEQCVLCDSDTDCNLFIFDEPTETHVFHSTHKKLFDQLNIVYTVDDACHSTQRKHFDSDEAYNERVQSIINDIKSTLQHDHSSYVKHVLK